MLWLSAASLAAASEVPPPEPEPEPEPPRVRHTSSGLGLGLAHVGVASPDGGGHDGGFVFDFRGEVPLAESFQLNFLLSVGITQPENTVAMVEWGWRHGGWTTNAFIDVTEWAGRGTEETRPFRIMGAFFGYTFLSLSYAVVPVVWVLSPFAAVGHTIVGPTFSWHSDKLAPNGFVEVGLGGSLYAHPVTGSIQAGYGPMAGVGLQAGKQTVGVRVLISPPGAHSDYVAPRETMVATSFVVTL